MRTTTLIVTLMFLAGPLVPLLPAAVAQEGDGCVADAAGDVTLYGPGMKELGGPAGQSPTPGSEIGKDPVAAFKMADVTSVCLGEETDRTFTLRVSIADLARQPSTMLVGQYLDVITCFTYTANDARYEIWTRLRYADSASVESGPGIVSSQLQLVDQCPNEYVESHDVQAKNRGLNRLNVTTTLEGNTLASVIARDTFTDPELNHEKNVGPAPTAGDALTDVLTRTLLWAYGPNWFIAGDDAAANPLEFVLSSCAGPLRLQVVSNLNQGQLMSLGIGGERLVPVYAVEVGSFQTVPVVVYNDGPEAINVNLSVDLKEGDPTDWDVRIIPSIPVAGSVDGHPGNTTVTLIVNSAPSIQHKDKVRIELRGTVNGGTGCARALVDVAGVRPPDEDVRTLYFHAQGTPCAGGSWWTNTLQKDPLDAVEELPFALCSADGSGGGGGLAGTSLFRFRPDVEHGRHYTLDALQPVTAAAAFKSVQYTPAGEQEVIVPVAADIVAELLAGDEVIAQGVAENVQLSDGGQAVEIALDLYPDNRLASTRYVPNENPLNVAFSVHVRDRKITYGNDLTGGERSSNVPSPSGGIRMMLPPSSVTIPIIDSERSGDIINVTKSGALVSLRTNAEKTAFMNPGKTKVFNITVRNEGVNLDTVTLKATMNKTGWLAKIQPKTSFRLGIGVADTFEVRIKVPEDAREGESVRMDLLAVSKVDPEATARMKLVVKATSGTIFQDEDPEFSRSGGVVEKKERSPGPGLLLGLALVVGAALLAGRRRRGN